MGAFWRRNPRACERACQRERCWYARACAATRARQFIDFSRILINGFNARSQPAFVIIMIMKLVSVFNALAYRCAARSLAPPRAAARTRARVLRVWQRSARSPMAASPPWPTALLPPLLTKTTSEQRWQDSDLAWQDQLDHDDSDQLDHDDSEPQR